MKKGIIIVILLVVLLSMGSAYGAWNDSVTVDVGVESATFNMGYVFRNNPANVHYTVQGQAVSGSNPYLYIEETTDPIEAGESSTSYKVKYKVKNLGSVPVVLKGISVSNMTFDTGVNPNNWKHSAIINTLTIRYRAKNNSLGYNEFVDVTNVESHTGVTFPDYENNIIYPGQQCIVILRFFRDTTGQQNIDNRDVIVTKTDRLIFSVYR